MIGASEELLPLVCGLGGAAVLGLLEGGGYCCGLAFFISLSMLTAALF